MTNVISISPHAKLPLETSNKTLSFSSTTVGSISTTNLQMLNHGEWLSDEVVTFYFKLLAKRDAELTAKNPGRTRSHFITYFFFT